ncbi:hypothetical protein OF829_18960 [Sphingomonas sp. LB-2]|uniref:hypothetical protein n=1 Tax=Sphingomonas caeni TaxID=2984949 RepID=UPI00222F8008|nr:hypothetical protein [Sphingomonas caeni]MCW3849324.1 hypothetical protein [Sphingomonas caeni]
MRSDDSGDYYRGREQQALALAHGAVDDNIRAIHLQMAEEYGRLATMHGSYTGAREKLAAG